MIKFKYLVPNGITILNLLAGSFAIIFVMEGDYDEWLPVYLMIAASTFDLLDGLTAKLLNATSEFGKQLDSLADIVSFCVLPSILMYKILIMVFVERGEGEFLIEETNWGERLLLFSAFNLLVFGSLRLARFNIQKEFSNDFKGLPVPASALFVVAIWVFVHADINPAILKMVLNSYFIVGVIVLLSILMISNLPMISLKFEGLGLRINSWRYILIIGAILLYVLFGMPSLIMIMFYYLLLSVVKVFIKFLIN